MLIHTSIEQKLLHAFQPVFLDVINESHMHSVAPGSESHFKVVIVTPLFDGMRLLQRHRAVNAVVAEELAEKIKVLDAAKKTIAVKDGVLTHKKGELEKIIADTEIEEKELRTKSEEARAHIDERLLYSYDRIRNSYRNGLAVVTVERDACGGCFNSIPPQRQSEIRLHKKIIVCENCGRILVEGELAGKEA